MNTGNINAYISSVMGLPMLTLEEEHDLAYRYRTNDDTDAGNKLVMTHLKLVVATARALSGYGLPQEDLIQEGNIGLMRAVKRFDASVGVRFATYALRWIKYEMYEYVIKNVRMVNIATTKPMRKLFFSLRTMKRKYNSDGANKSLSTAHIAEIATELGVKIEEVAEMEKRFAGGDTSIDIENDDGDTSFSDTYLMDTSNEPTEAIMVRDRERLGTDGISSALDKLDARSKHIIESRWINVGDDGLASVYLQELATIYGVSAERIRQIEKAALQKMKTSLETYA